MPLVTLPTVVETFLRTRRLDRRPHLLIIGENFPRPYPGEYFYRSIMGYHGLSAQRGYFDALCTSFGVPIINDIIFSNPKNIMFIHNNNKKTVAKLFADPRFAPYIPKIVCHRCENKIDKFVFPFPSGAAPAIHFIDALARARACGYPI